MEKMRMMMKSTLEIPSYVYLIMLQRAIGHDRSLAYTMTSWNSLT